MDSYMAKIFKIYLISTTCLLIIGASIFVNAQTYYGNQFQVTTTVSMGYLDAIDKKASLRFTAQASKTVSSFRIYIYDNEAGSKTYRYGIQTDSGGVPSGTWLGYKDLDVVGGSGWLTVVLASGISVTSGTVYHIVVEPVDNPSKAIALQATTPLNQMIVYDNASDTNSNTLFYDGTGWTIQNYQPIYFLDYSDATYEGNPCSFPSYGSVYGTRYESQKFTMVGGDKIITEVAVFIKRGGSPPNDCDFVLFNITDSVEVASGTIATSSEVTPSYAWYTHTLSASKTLIDGKEYRLYLKTIGGDSNNKYMWHMPYNYDAADYNSRNYDGLNSINQSSTDGGSNWSQDWPNYDAVFRFTLSTSILSVTLRNADDSADYTSWDIGSGKQTDTVYLMDTTNCVLVKNDGTVAEDFSISGTGTNWTLGSSAAEDTCVLMGLFNASTAPAEGEFSNANDLITTSPVWATYVADGSGKFQGANDGDNVLAGTGEKLYIYLKTPSSITQGDQETITVTIGCREH
ncbi:MAG: hypothetical protein AB1567_01015 [bacterium]